MTNLNPKDNNQDVAVIIEGNIVRYKMTDNVGDEKIKHLIDIGTQILDENIASLVLVDIDEVQKLSLATRGCWIQFLKDPRIKKVAIFGGNQFINTVASFIVSTLQADKGQLFSTEEEALNWLRS